MLSISEFYGSAPDESFASQGLRVLLDEGDTPSATDIDLALRLASAAAPHLGQKQFSEHGGVRFRLSQPLMQVWRPVDFSAPDLLDDRPMFWIPDGEYWVHDGDDYLLDHSIWTHSTLGEPLDLALVLINIDAPDIYLRVLLTPMPKRSKNPVGCKITGEEGSIETFRFSGYEQVNQFRNFAWTTTQKTFRNGIHRVGCS